MNPYGGAWIQAAEATPAVPFVSRSARTAVSEAASPEESPVSTARLGPQKFRP